MDITFKKRMDDLQKEVKLKSADLEDTLEDYKVEIEPCSVADKFITISPRCVRCNLCVQECPVDAISKADASRQAKILDNCVKCEICAQTCPVRCIRVMESLAHVNDEVEYELKDLKIPHRVLKMEDIAVKEDKCISCGTCARFCPTQAIKVPEGEVAVIDKDLCIGCGACVNVCDAEAIDLERYLGPVLQTQTLLIDEEACVQCQMCEELCPTSAIRLDEDDNLILDEDKCILCGVCSNKCPVSALSLVR